MSDPLHWAEPEKCCPVEHPYGGPLAISWTNLQLESPNLGILEGKQLHKKIIKTTRDSWNGCVSWHTKKKKGEWIKGCRLTHPRHNALLPLLVGLELHQVASPVTQTHKCTNPYRKRRTNRSSDISDHRWGVGLVSSPWFKGLLMLWPCGKQTLFDLDLVRRSTCPRMTSPLGGDLWTSTFLLFFSFSSSRSLPPWWCVTHPAHTHFINQEGFVSAGAVLESNVLVFFTVPREAASSHRSRAKSLNTCLCEALYDTHRHKRKYQMQRCLSPWQHSKESLAEHARMQGNSKLTSILIV